jgi:hypothetical protein
MKFEGVKSVEFWRTREASEDLVHLKKIEADEAELTESMMENRGS